MNNLEAKQEAIKNAYGECWEKVKDYIDKNGWIYCKDVDFFKDCGLTRDEVHYIDNDKEWDNFKIISWRLPIINGIENNNGWIKIESEKDLPKVSGLYFGKDYEFGTDMMYFDFETKKWEDSNGYLQNVTHYQPIKKPKPPIY